MTPEQLKFINISVEMCGVIISVLGIVLIRVGTKMEKNTSKRFESMFLCLAVDLL